MVAGQHLRSYTTSQMNLIDPSSVELDRAYLMEDESAPEEIPIDHPQIADATLVPLPPSTASSAEVSFATSLEQLLRPARPLKNEHLSSSHHTISRFPSVDSNGQSDLEANTAIAHQYPKTDAGLQQATVQDEEFDHRSLLPESDLAESSLPTRARARSRVYPPVPESTQESPESSQYALGSSLDGILDSYHPRGSAHDSSEDEDAVNTALPPSIASLDDLNRMGYGKMAYIDRVARQAHRLHHLKNILSRPRFNNGASVTWYDYKYDSPLEVQEGSIGELHIGHTKEEIYRARAQLKNVSLDVHMRMFVAHDLSLETMDFLGSVLDVSPECFAEHLYGSAYNNKSGTEADPRSWSTSGMQKDYISVSWLRPIVRSQRSISAGELRKLLDHRYDGIQWSEKRTVEQGATLYPIELQHQQRSQSNIVRTEFPLKTNVHNGKWDASSWKERLTLWTGTIGHAHVGKNIYHNCQFKQ